MNQSLLTRLADRAKPGAFLRTVLLQTVLLMIIQFWNRMSQVENTTYLFLNVMIVSKVMPSQ